MRKKLLSAILSLALVATCLPVGVVAAEKEAAPEKKTIEVTAQGISVDDSSEDKTKKYVCFPTKMSVDSDVAEEYGYTDAVEDGVSGLDVLVALSKNVYGDSFTKETASQFLEVPGGWITRIFKQETSNVGFILNGELPFTAVNETVVTDDSSMTFFIYSDTVGYSDVFCQPTKDCTTVTTYGKTVKVAFTGKGYDSSWTFTDASLEGTQIGYYKTSSKASDAVITKIKKVTLDQNGKASFSGLNAGTYWVTPFGNTANDAPVIMNPVKITIKKANQKVTVKVSSKNYKAKNVKKKAQKFSIGTKVLDKAKVSYKSSKSKYVKVSNSGKVTIKKGTPKGTYKVKITVAATKNYNATTKTVTIKVK